MKDNAKHYYLKTLMNSSSFSRNDLLQAMKENGVETSDSSFKVVLQRLLKDELIVRIGRNAYCVANNEIKVYEHEYTEEALKIAELIKRNFPYLNFTILDLIQLNEFTNHQLAHNVIHVSVEGNLGEFVFNVLKDIYPGKVLINPTLDVYHQYWYDGMIVIGKLVSESPMGQKQKWNTRIEKMLVDIMTNPILHCSISESELPTIYEEVFAKYAVDESCLFRYAKRRGADKKIHEFIEKNTNIQLRIG